MLYLLLWTKLKPYTCIRRFVFYQFLLFLCCCCWFFFPYVHIPKVIQTTVHTMIIGTGFMFRISHHTSNRVALYGKALTRGFQKKKKNNASTIFFYMFILIELLFGSMPKTGSVDFCTDLLQWLPIRNDFFILKKKFISWIHSNTTTGCRKPNITTEFVFD